MEQQMTLLYDIDPMMDDVKVLARCISIWKSHAAGKPNQPWGLDVVLQDPEGNRIQASIKLENMNKFLAVLDEGSCYRIGDFGVGENGGNGRQLECCFYEGWAEKFNDYANQNETTGPVVMILQLARVKYFNDKASVSNCLFSTKLYLNEDIPEIVAFKQRSRTSGESFLFAFLGIIHPSQRLPNNSGGANDMNLLKL
ncbi:replication protein A 70 kDa DNA-binding subunit B [Tanacetum coccineum]